MAVGETLADAVLEFVLRGDFDLFVSLHTAEPDGVSNHEVSGAGYGREALIAADWEPAADGMITTLNQISFAPAGASWGTVTHVGLFDAFTGGNFMWAGPMITPKAVSTGDTIVFPAGNLSGTVV